MTDHDDLESLFWDVADEQIASHDDVQQGTMMGHACLRVGGEFSAMVSTKDGFLVVKLPASRVAALIEDGTGEAFAPAGKVFKEWVAIAAPTERLCGDLLGESRVFLRG